MNPRGHGCRSAAEWPGAPACRQIPGFAPSILDVASRGIEVIVAGPNGERKQNPLGGATRMRENDVLVSGQVSFNPSEGLEGA